MVALQTAQTSAPIAAKIDAVNAQLTQVTNALGNSATIVGGSLIINVAANLPQVTVSILGLSTAESATVFNSMISILNARISRFDYTTNGGNRSTINRESLYTHWK